MKRLLKAPLLSITDEQLPKLPYPVYGSPKLDGFRCGIVNGEPRTNSMKEIKNRFIREYLTKPEFNLLDGEIIVGPPHSPDAFANTRGPVTRHKGKSDFKLYVFDYMTAGSYADRWIASAVVDDPRIVVLPQTILNTPEEVKLYTDWCIGNDYEGAMLRTKTGIYKQGRATFNEMNIFKRKPLDDAEGKIVGFIEQMTNTNEKTVNEMGLTSRSTSKEGKVPAGTLGSFMLESSDWPGHFRCGPGKLTHKRRQEIWDNKEAFLGKTVTYTYQSHGSIDKPRQPRFKRFFKEV